MFVLVERENREEQNVLGDQVVVQAEEQSWRENFEVGSQRWVAQKHTIRFPETLKYTHHGNCKGDLPSS